MSVFLCVWVFRRGCSIYEVSGGGLKGGGCCEGVWGVVVEVYVWVKP